MITAKISRPFIASVQVIAILAVCIILFMPWWKDGKACAPLDIVTNLYEPWADSSKPIQVQNHNSTDNVEHYLLYRYFAQQSNKDEGRVGWNPLKGGGTADYANTMATPYDFTYIFYRFLPFWHAWNLGMMLQYMIAMLGMFIFLRHQKYCKWLCLAGALAYGLNTHFAGWIFHRWALGAFCWTPWYLWALMGLRERRRFGLVAPLFLAVSFFGGHLQYAAFQVFVCIAFTLGWYLEDLQRNRGISFRPLGSMIGVGLVSVLLAGIMFIPCAYAFRVTMQSGLVRGGLGYPEGFGTALKTVLAYPSSVFPMFHGAPGSFDLGRILNIQFFALPFFGSVFLLLSFAGFFIKSGNVTAKIIALMGIVLPLTPLVGPLYTRLMVFYALGGIWLAVDLISCCPDRMYIGFSKLAKFVFFAVLLAVFALSTALLLKYDFIHDTFEAKIVSSIPAHRFGARPEWFIARIDKLLKGLMITHPRIWIPLLGFGISTILLKYRGRKFFGPALAACVLAQLWIPHKEWMTFVTPPENSMSQIYPRTVEVRAIQDAVGQDGRIVVAQTKGRLPLFPPNSLTYFGITCLNVYDSFLPNGMEPHGNVNPWLEDLSPAKFYGSIGVSHLVTFRDASPDDPGWILQATAGKIAIYSNQVVRARYETFTETGDKRAIQPEVSQRNFRSLVIPSTVERLSVCENHALGWESRIDDGPWLPMDRAEDGSMSAKLTPSEKDRQLEMRYNPPEKRLGRFVSAFGIVFFFGFVLFYCRDIRKQRQVLS